MNDSNMMVASEATLNYSFTEPGLVGVGTDFTFDPWQPQPYQPVIERYYPSCLGHWTTEDTISKAFKIVQKLIDKKMVKVVKIKDFIELVNLIAKEI